MIKINKEKRKPEKRYRIVDAAKAIGLSENAVYGFFSNDNISVKNGITLAQIEAVCEGPRRGQGIRWEDVREIRDRLLDEYGTEITEE